MAHDNIATYLTLFTRRLVRRVLPNTTLTDDAINQIVAGYFHNGNLTKLSVFAVGGLYFKLFADMKREVAQGRRYTFDSMQKNIFHSVTSVVHTAQSRNRLYVENEKYSGLFLDYIEQLTGSIIFNHALKDAAGHYPTIVMSEVCDEHSAELKSYYGKQFVMRASDGLRCGGAQAHLLDKAVEVGIGKRRVVMDFPVDASIPKGSTQDVVIAFKTYGDSYIRKILTGDPQSDTEQSVAHAAFVALFPKAFFN